MKDKYWYISFCGFFCYRYPGGFWFRIFGYGISIEDRTTHPPLFSERNGYSKPLRIGKYAIKTLKP